MKNNALTWQPWIDGTYSLSDVVNGKASWTLKNSQTGSNQAIWYLPKHNEWAIGPLEKIGSNESVLISFGGQGSLDLLDVPSQKWEVWNDDHELWHTVARNDVAIQCKGIKQD